MCLANILWVGALLWSLGMAFAIAAPRETIRFDFAWRFSPALAGSQFALPPRRAPNDSLPLPASYWSARLDDTYATGALSPSFDDSKYELIDVPHDFLINGTVNRSTPRGRGSFGNWPGGYPPGSFLPRHNGIYRKHFHLPSDWGADRTIWLRFDGVWRNSRIYLNGVALGPVHGSGYTSFTRRLDNSSALRRGKGGANVLAVFVDGSHGTGWWYEVRS